MPDSQNPGPGADARALETRAHVLYWNSDRSVNSIADEMGLSKGRLYDLVRPLSAGRTCPECRSDLVFENRTARDQDDAACPVCDGARIPLTASGAPPDEPSMARFGSPRPAGSRRETDSGTGPADAGAGAFASTRASAEGAGVLGGIAIGMLIGFLLGRFLR